MSIATTLRMRAAERPLAEAIIDRERRINYAEFNHLADQLAAGLALLEVSRGDRVALWLPNCIEYLISYLACLRVGAIAVPINIRFGDDEVEYILRHSGASIVFTTSEFLGNDYLTRIIGLKNRIEGLRTIVTISRPASLEDGLPVIRYDELMSEPSVDAASAWESAAESGDIALIMYTSGSTGRPKGAMITHGGLEAYGIAALSAGLFEAEDRILVAVPLATTAGSIVHTVPALTGGAALVLMDQFKASASLAMIQAERITCFAAPPTIYILQLNAPDFDRYDLSSLRRVIVGAAPVPAQLMIEIQNRMAARVINSYGATETGGLVTSLPAGAPNEKVISACGRAIPGYELKIAGNERETLGIGQLGELAVRGRSITAGYYNDLEQTKAAIDPEGWWYSGDLARIDEDGYLKIEGRKKEMYIRGGFNIYPAEIEDVLHRHPAILICAVIGVPDPVLGECGKAFIVVKEGSRLSADEVKEFCRGKLADYKIPDYIVFRESLPLAGLGKVRKIALMEESRAESGEEFNFKR
ncbi:MAG: AMP-binding protein [Candidatus Binataceae bacterium]